MKYIHFITKAFSEIPPKMSFDGFSKDFAEVCSWFAEIFSLGEYPQLDQALSTWVRVARAKNVSFTDEVLNSQLDSAGKPCYRTYAYELAIVPY